MALFSQAEHDEDAERAEGERLRRPAVERGHDVLSREFALPQRVLSGRRAGPAVVAGRVGDAGAVADGPDVVTRGFSVDCVTDSLIESMS